LACLDSQSGTSKHSSAVAVTASFNVAIQVNTVYMEAALTGRRLGIGDSQERYHRGRADPSGLPSKVTFFT
jgi:hypothetical protein